MKNFSSELSDVDVVEVHNCSLITNPNLQLFSVVTISGDRYQFAADSECEKSDWMRVLEDACRISARKTYIFGSYTLYSTNFHMVQPFTTNCLSSVHLRKTY